MKIILILLMIAVVGVLVTGIGGMVVGGAFNRKNSNKLMRLRIGFQAAALVLFALLLLKK